MTKREMRKGQLEEWGEMPIELDLEVADYVRDMATQLALLCVEAKMQEISEHLVSVATEVDRIVELRAQHP